MKNSVKKYGVFMAWGAGIFALFAIVRAQFPDAPPAPPVGASAPASVPVAKSTKEVEVVAPVGKYSEPVAIPPFQWFRYTSAGKKACSRNIKGEEFCDSKTSGKPTWHGDSNVANFAWAFKSEESEPVKIRIVYQEK